MATVKENLIAAKALIDTPEKFAQVVSMSGALDRVTEPRSAQRRELYDAVSNAYNRRNPTNYSDWESVITRLDRAIAAQGETP